MLGRGMPVGQRKSDEVARLLKILENGSPSSEDVRQLQTLMQLKVLGRDQKDADALFCKDGISILAKYAFAEPSLASREASRCIANALLLAPSLRQVFIDLDLVDKAAALYNSQNYDDEFLGARILFLLTYGTTLDYDNLLHAQKVGSGINAHIQHHARAAQEGSTMQVAPLSESLKLLFNLSRSQEQAVVFEPSIAPIVSMLSHIPTPVECLDPPVNLLVNALVNIELASAQTAKDGCGTLFPADNKLRFVSKVTDILYKATKSYKATELETLLPPLLTVLRKIHDVAPSDVRKYLQESLLPERQNRDLPIGQSDTLPSRLLRLSTSAMTQNLREIIPALMFELSGKDAKTYIENVGYGFAAGFLTSHSIPMPESAMSTQADGMNTSQINPITGQRLDREPVDTGPEMTMEEKEREAEKLFVLFERLEATGVVNVKNPVRQMMEEMETGSQRVEELDDSD